MIGSTELANRAPRLAARRYFAVDGGAGRALLLALSGRSPALREVASPRHANLILVLEPIGRSFEPAVAEAVRAMPRPGAVMRVPAEADVYETLAQALAIHSKLERRTEPPELETTTVRLPVRTEQEIATESVVASLGPIQPFTAGPLRLLLTCDGEQVAGVHVSAGYAHRGVADSMTRVDPRDAASAAAQLDPLAPVAGRVAYLRALERLQGMQPAGRVEAAREAALGTERVINHLQWAARFFEVVGTDELAARARELALAPPPAKAAAIADFARRVRRDRFLRFRTRGIGMLPLEQIEQAGIADGPVLQASRRAAGDVESRLGERLDVAAQDASEAHELADAGALSTEYWKAPAGQAEAEALGPRGAIGVRLLSDGRERLSQVQWRRPSERILSLVPDLLRGAKLADAEAILASLDLSMAEADG